MKIVVIGTGGLIGSRLVTRLDEHGHATPSFEDAPVLSSSRHRPAAALDLPRSFRAVGLGT
jgi:uncharacterized protein YbjT (DUF2867 family)